jgi:phosphate transport system substrate-binding protein
MKWFKYTVLLLLAGCGTQQTTIKIKGSDTEVNLAVLLVERYHALDADGAFISISGGGSGLGIAALLNGTADIANSSRRINTEEARQFAEQDIRIDSFIFADDAIAFVVSDQLPIDSIDTETLAKTLDGTYENWLPLTGQKRPINIYGRQSNSGTHDFIEKQLGIEFGPHAKQMNGNAQILEALRVDDSGIGYVGAGYLRNGGDKGLRVLKISSPSARKAVSPLDAEMVAQGKYFFQRPLYQYFKAASYSKIRSFLEFEAAPAVLAIIASAGYYPHQR